MFDFEWDEEKRRKNIAKHGVDFYDIADFDWRTCIRFIDARKEYGEDRWIATGMISRRLHVCAFTVRENRYRIIMLRKANKREIDFYETQTVDE